MTTKAADLSSVARARLLDGLPLGVVLIDAMGVIRYANGRAGQIAHYESEQIIGSNLLTLVHPDDAGFAVDALTHGHNYSGSVMGPIPIHYLDGHGQPRRTELWAQQVDDIPELGGSGFLLTVAEETASDGLANAARAIARGEPIETSLTHVAQALSGHPVLGVGSVLLARDDGLVAMGGWPLGSEFLWPQDATTPWATAIKEHRGVDFADPDVLPYDVRERFATLDLHSMWIRPLGNGRGLPVGAVVVMRHEGGRPSPNQELCLREAAAVALLGHEHRQHRSSMERAAHTDPLTGVSNRTRLTECREAHLHDVAVLYLDLDGFKAVNTDFGHGVGDTVLATVGQRILAEVRTTDEVIRVGGDEFVVLCHDTTTRDDVFSIADRVVARLAEPYFIPHSGGHITIVSKVSASVGVGFQTEEMSLDETLHSADVALAAAKQAGKSCWQVAG